MKAEGLGFLIIGFLILTIGPVALRHLVRSGVLNLHGTPVYRKTEPFQFWLFLLMYFVPLLAVGVFLFTISLANMLLN